jgi:hypothetical protein
MESIRACTQDDIPQVARLYQAVFGGGARFSLKPLEDYFRTVFFENPWSDGEVPSWVYESESRRIEGFLGVIPRRFNLKGRPVKGAVSSQLMVSDSSRHSLAAFKLLRAFFKGPQDLSFTDGANEVSRKTWKALGGVEVPIYSLCWTRSLRPLHGEFGDAAPDVTEQDLDIPTVLENLPKLTRHLSLRPEYDSHFLQWLFNLAEQKKKHGRLQNRLLRDAYGIVGWYVYYLNVGGMSQVLQLVAAPLSFRTVLVHCFRTLQQQGATAVSGKLDPQYLHELSRQQCQFSAASAVLVQASDPALIEAIYRGDAMLSRLEGEWWNCFGEFIERPQVSQDRGLRTLQ